MENRERFEEAIRRFDAENARDPNQELAGGKLAARELLYAERLTAWLLRLQPEASEALRLAARCQHLCRWRIPRKDYPMDRSGYLKWRNELKRFHAELSGKILRECGYDEKLVRRVQELNLKKNFPADPESQALEDALCLVFLEFQLTELARKTEPEKVINALRKSWAKMSPRAREAALGLEHGEREKKLLGRALAEENRG